MKHEATAPARTEMHERLDRALMPRHEDAERLDWLGQRLLEMPAPYADLIGLPSGWTNLREAIDAVRGAA